jgi:hypothetical protein
LAWKNKEKGKGWLDGPNRFWAPSGKQKGFQISFSANMNLKPKFKFKLPTFLNSDKLKYFTKTQT